MNYDFFNTQIDRLKNAHGQNSYGGEFTKLLWDEFQHMKQDHFEWVIDQLISELRTQAPLSKFRELRRISFSQFNFVNTTTKEVPDCHYCCDKGWCNLKAYKELPVGWPMLCAAVCECAVGNRLYNNLLNSTDKDFTRRMRPSQLTEFYHKETMYCPKTYQGMTLKEWLNQNPNILKRIPE
jgi:hypothetical protein